MLVRPSLPVVLKLYCTQAGGTAPSPGSTLRSRVYCTALGRASPCSNVLHVVRMWCTGLECTAPFLVVLRVLCTRSACLHGTLQECTKSRMGSWTAAHDGFSMCSVCCCLLVQLRMYGRESCFMWLDRSTVSW